MSSATRFGLFEVDFARGELRKQGHVVRLQQQPFGLLKVLLAHPGEVVSRDRLRQELWPSGMSIDFDQSLNKSVTKLRDALGDSAASPRFIETLPRKGYRFIAPVTIAETAPASVATEAPPPPSPLIPSDVVPVRAPRVSARWWLSALAVAAMLVVVLLNFTGAKPLSDTLAVRPHPSAQAGTTDQAAREAYERGRIALSRRTEDGLQNGLRLFQRAVAFDPTFAAAFVGLSDAWSLLASYGMEQPGPALQQARDSAERALTLAPDNADAHASMGRLLMIGAWDWKRAEKHFQRSLALQEGSATPHRWYAYLLSATGRHAEAEREARRAMELEPASLNAATGLGYVLYAARRYDTAAVELRRVIEVAPDFMQARRNLGFVLAMQGRHQEAIAEFERVARLSDESAMAQADLIWGRGRSGDIAGARRLLARLQARRHRGYVPPDALALALAGAGHVESAVQALEQAVADRVPTMAHFGVDPMWDTLRGLERVRALTDSLRAASVSRSGHGLERPEPENPRQQQD